MKFNLLASIALTTCFTSIANAQATITFGGEVNSEIGVRNQSKDYEFDNPQAAESKNGDIRIVDLFPKNELHQGAVVNDTKVNIGLEMLNDNGVELGGKIELSTDTSLNKHNNTTYDSLGLETYAFAESDFGRLEGGSTTGVYDDMKVSGANVARATGGIDGDVKYWWNPYIYKDGTVPVKLSKPADPPFTKFLLPIGSAPARLVEQNFIISPNLPSNYDHGGEANAAKISYITPSMEGIRIGVTYIPEIEQHGSVSLAHSKIDRINTFNDTSLGFQKIISSTATFENKFNETNVKISLAGEVGDAKDVKDPNFVQTTYLLRHNLKAWEVGAGIDDSGFSLAGSYGNWGDSGNLKILENTGCKRSDYWTLGGGYSTDDVGFSITYFGSSRCGLDSRVGYSPAFIPTEDDREYRLARGTKALSKAKKVEILSFGLDTKLAAGFMPFAELSFFKLNENNGNATDLDVKIGKGTDYPRSSHNRKNQGYFLMSGVKIQF
jgi:hypothetical protein